MALDNFNFTLSEALRRVVFTTFKVKQFSHETSKTDLAQSIAQEVMGSIPVRYKHLCT
jgi:hypothetical protein